MKARSPLPWPILAVAAEVLIGAVDLAFGDDLILTGAYVIPVLALALVARPGEVLAVAGLAGALSLASGVWNDYLLSADHIVRLGIVLVGGVLAAMIARARASAEEERGRMAVLADVARMSDVPTIDRALDALGRATVPVVADRVWVDLTEEDGERRRAFESGPAAGGDEVVLPLRVREQPIGELGFAGSSYDEQDRAFFAVLAGRVSLALANVRLLDELTRTRERLDRILGSLAEAVTVHDADGRTVYANVAARELLGIGDEPALPAEPGALAARFIVTHEDGSPVPTEEYPGRRLVAGEHDPPPLVTRSVRRDTGREYWLLTKATLLHDADGAPLAVNVIEDVTEAKDAELRQRFLDGAGQVLGSSLDHEQALRRVCELAVPWLADWAAVDLADGPGIRRVAIAHADPAKLVLADELARRFPPDPESATGVSAVIRSGEAQRFDEVTDAMIDAAVRDDEHRELIRRIGMRAAMIIPMTAGDEVLGAMMFVSAESGRSFDDDDFAFAQDLARRAAVAVQNGRLYAEQVRVAVTLQRSLLPDRLPTVPGWEAAASYEAGDQRAEVGGDFYDVVPTEGGHLAFLGDVTGKGIDAAALTALVRHSAKMAARFDRRPSAVLALVNQVLLEQPRLAPVSVVCALVEDGDSERARHVTVASAGHPLPLLKRPGEAPREVGRHDVLLGVIEHAEFDEQTFEIGPGDVLLLYTDGVLDAPGAEERFGERRLREVVAGAPEDPFALLQTIETALRGFVLAEGADDRAMLALRYTGAGVRGSAGCQTRRRSSSSPAPRWR